MGVRGREGVRGEGKGGGSRKGGCKRGGGERGRQRGGSPNRLLLIYITLLVVLVVHAGGVAVCKSGLREEGRGGGRSRSEREWECLANDKRPAIMQAMGGLESDCV